MRSAVLAFTLLLGFFAASAQTANGPTDPKAQKTYSEALQALRTRRYLDEIAREAKLQGRAQALKGADFTLTGDVVEFGRKEVGDRALFGILGSGKQQVAYSKVTLNVVDVVTSEIVYSVQGAGEYALSNREVLGFGGTAGYDSTLNGKVLDLAIREAIDRLVDGVQDGKWRVSKEPR